MTRTGLSFKEVLNRSIRRGLLLDSEDKIKVEPLFLNSLPSEFSEVNWNHIAELWDDEETLRELKR